jgi:hypothetical protein
MLSNDELEQKIISLEERVRRLETKDFPLTGSRGLVVTSSPPEVNDDTPVSTIKVPEVSTVEFSAPGQSKIEFATHKDVRERRLSGSDESMSNPSSSSAVSLPVTNYDRMTVGELTLAIKNIKTDEERNRWLDYEKTHKNRQAIVDLLVNWNS